MFSPHIPVITLCLPLISVSEATLTLTIMKHGSNDLQLLSINTYTHSYRHYHWQWNYIFIKPVQIMWLSKTYIPRRVASWARSFRLPLKIFKYLKRSTVLGNNGIKAYRKFSGSSTSDRQICNRKVFVLWFIYICPDWLTACASQGQNFQERKCAYVDSFA